MRRRHHKLISVGFTLLTLSWASLHSVYAAIAVDLQNQSVTFLQSLSMPVALNGTSVPSSFKSLRSDVDFNQTTHLRIQQTYGGYPVWGGDAVVHVPAIHSAKTLSALLRSGNQKTVTMNGVVYDALAADLQNTPATIFSTAARDKALQQAMQLYQQQAGHQNAISQSNTKLIVYIDKNSKAHWAFLTSFLVSPVRGKPEKPTFIMDAMTAVVYQQWDNVQTLENISGGGFGGNPKMGKIAYDSLKGDYPALSMKRDPLSKLCYLKNKDVIVEDGRESLNYPITQFVCNTEDAQHNAIYWDADQDKANEAYSPSNDALYVGKVVKEMYQNWYGIPVLTKNNKPMMLKMVVHVDMENAVWTGDSMYFGDGGTDFYPLVSLGVGAHEISHGFTEQHSNLIYDGQSGGLNESFSDMAAQAAEYYSAEHNSWQIGPEIMKAKDIALRYMDNPTKDCGLHKPGHGCSIDNVKDYKEGIDVHFSSGIFNKIFYLMGSANGWDTRKAFDVMEQANAHYWTATSTFAEAACGVVKATIDYKYDLAIVTQAMAAVGIDTNQC